MITILNKHKISDEHALAADYIGRGSPLGNPFLIDMSQGQTRDVVVEKYDRWLNTQIEHNNRSILNELDRLAHKYLAEGELQLLCFCAPAKCHGESIRRKIRERTNQLFDQRIENELGQL